PVPASASIHTTAARPAAASFARAAIASSSASLPTKVEDIAAILARGALLAPARGCVEPSRPGRRRRGRLAQRNQRAHAVDHRLLTRGPGRPLLRGGEELVERVD